MTRSESWGLYARLSDNPDGTKTGTDRQLADGDDAAARRGGAVVERYVEDDTSAFRQKAVQRRDPLGNEYTAYRVIRPVWAQALHDLRIGKIGVLWVWDLDRLARDNRDLEDAIEVVTHYGGAILDGTGSVNLMSDEGRVMARFLVAMANKASASASKRIVRWHQEQREKGRPLGGTRPFGWEADRATLRPSEAAVVRKAFEGIVERGTTFHEIAIEWAEAGWTTPRGNIIRRSFVREVMSNPRLAGYRTYKDEIVGEGAWEPILTKDEWERLKVCFAPKRPGVGNHRKYVFSGFLRCGICMKSMTAYARRPGVHVYGCRAKADGGCGGLSRDGRAVDAYLTELVLAWWETYGATLEAAGGATPWPGEAELAEVDSELAEVAALARTRKGASLALVLDRLDALDAAANILRATRSAHHAQTASRHAVPTNLRAQWDSLSLAVRQEAISRAMLGCVVKPAGRGARFDPALLEPAMRQPAAVVA